MSDEVRTETQPVPPARMAARLRSVALGAPAIRKQTWLDAAETIDTVTRQRDELARLLRDAHSTFRDPALARRWGMARRRILDDVLDEEPERLNS